MCIIKRKLKFQDYKNFLEAVQTENKINRLEKNKVEVNSLKEDKKKIMKNSKLISKTKNKDLQVKSIRFWLKKLIRLL